MSYATATGEGDILAAGYRMSREAGVEYFITEVGPGGQLTTVITNTFVPVLVCAAADGTVWSFGRDLTKGKFSQDYAMLRQYRLRERPSDSAIGQLNELLPRHSFDSKLSPAGGRGSAKLRCVDDKVVVYTSATHEYIEVLDSGETVRRFKVEEPPEGLASLFHLAVASDGHVFASVRNRGWDSSRVHYLQLDEPTWTARWVAVPGADTTSQEGAHPRYGLVYGTDGDSLVLGESGHGLAWVRPRVVSNK